jgi:2-methylfumaryl-CoA hydratase
LLVFHQVLGQTVRHASLNAVANLGYAELLFHPGRARAGCTVHATNEVIGLKENSSGTSGIVWLKTIGRSEDGQELLSYVRWVMVRKRDAAPTAWRASPVIPKLCHAVSPQQLQPAALQAASTATPQSGWTFQDYQVGERIFHHDGHTVTPGEHMSFTRSFQNSARVHFDAIETNGKPLVFGGYVMSIGYAQMLNGMENRRGLVAINAGTHAHPVHAGDTLYSMTDVLQTDPLADAPLGALRCRLRVLKNDNPAKNPQRTYGPAREEPSVVLDLDLWELMPKAPRPPTRSD